MSFENVNTPEELMDYFDRNFQFGVIDNCGNKHIDSNSDSFQYICDNEWKLRSVEEILNAGIGHCYDQVEIERRWFEEHGYPVKTFWISAYQEGVENSGFCHTYLMFKSDNLWHIFEHSDYFNKGIHKFNSIREAVAWQAEMQIKNAETNIKPINKYITCIKEYQKPPVNINMSEFLDHIENADDYIFNNKCL